MKVEVSWYVAKTVWSR